MDLKIQWLGTAGFRIEHRGWVGLIDPYVSRNPFSRPRLNISASQVAEGCKHIFLSNGHFNHIKDIPLIVENRPDAQIFGSKVVCRTLKKQLNQETVQLHPIRAGEIPSENKMPQVEAFPAKHVRYGLRHSISILIRCLSSPAKSYADRKLLRNYPAGPSLAYLFQFGDFKILHLGSLGAKDRIVQQWSKLEIDCLLLPLRGSLRWKHQAQDLIQRINPKRVIPHHFDDFFPPISRAVSISEFLKKMERELPQIQFQILKFGERYQLNNSKADASFVLVNSPNSADESERNNAHADDETLSRGLGSGLGP